MADKIYTATAVREAGMTVAVKARNHTIVIDEPVEQGGTDKGMNPVELLLSSIAACLTLTITIYAEAMGVKLRGIEVDAEGVLDSAGMKGSRKARPGFKSIKITVNAKSEAEPEVFRQVIDLALLRCPVEDSVAHGVEFAEPEIHIEAVEPHADQA